MEAFHYSSDEILHIDLVRSTGLREMMKFSLYETHPPLGNLLRYYFLRLCQDPWFMRSESLIFGILLIPLYYRIGKILDGELTGMMSALLIAFSNGCIAQSFIVRDYTLCVLFISSAFYCYLQWRKHGGRNALAAYSAFFCLAMLTHVMAGFALLCLFAYETLEHWLCKAPRRKQVEWILANLLVLACGAWVYGQLRPSLKAYSEVMNMTNEGNLNVMLAYPMFLLQELLPERVYNSFVIASFVITVMLLFHLSRNVREARFILWRMLFAVAVGMFLLLANFYPYINTRHVLWLLPFVIPPVAWALSAFCRTLSGGIVVLLPSVPPRHALATSAILIALAIASTYSAESRFLQTFEYTMPETAWRGLAAYLEGLDNDQLILAGKADMFQLDPAQNPYRLFSLEDSTTNLKAIAIPYHKTRIVFGSFGYHLNTDSVLLRFAENARNQNLFAGVKDVVIVNTLYQSPAIVDLMLCPSLQKEVVTFPPASPSRPLTREMLYQLPASLLIVPAEVFLRDVVSPDGKAHECFSKRV